MVASLNGNSEVVKLLVEAGADVGLQYKVYFKSRFMGIFLKGYSLLLRHT